MSNHINLVLFEDESVLSSSICVNSAHQRRIDNHGNPHHSNALEISENYNVSIDDREGVANKRSKKGKRNINRINVSMETNRFANF